MPAYAACVSIRQHTSAYVSSIREAGGSAVACPFENEPAYVSIHVSIHVSIRQHPSAYVSIRQHASAYVRACLAAEDVHAASD